MREKWILPYIKGKKVLDIGSIGNYSDSLYYFMKPYCKKLIGTDIRMGEDKDILVRDMEYQSVKGTFDVVVAGDVIEHLGNQREFIINMHRHLKEDGLFIITTPNAKSVAPYLTFLSEGFKYHTLWHTVDTLRFALKDYFKIIKVIYYAGNRKRYDKLNIIPFINRNQLFVVTRKI
jgi:SAM-dependent methyltransferase